MRRIALTAILILAGCSSAPPERTASQALLDGLPVPPASARVESASGPEAVEVVYRSGLPSDSVAAWYRRWFLEQGWEINGDARLPDGGVVLQAQRDGRPVWLMTSPDPAAGSRFSLMGAEPGSAPPAP